LLPALPNEWANGEITGLRAYGGFEVNIEWENNLVKKVVIKSNLGGNLRIRTPNALTIDGGNEPALAAGININPFFDEPKIKEPLISASANIKAVSINETIVYDIPTKAGEVYIFKYQSNN
jgi:alpha-L-fucosidase 2